MKRQLSNKEMGQGKEFGLVSYMYLCVQLPSQELYLILGYFFNIFFDPSWKC